MKYKNYTVADFIEDEYFMRWVKKPDERSDKFWKLWITNHPEKTKDLMQARHIIISMKYEEAPDFFESDYIEVLENILKKNRSELAREKRESTPFHSLFSYKVAAIIAIFIVAASGFVWLYWEKEDRPVESMEPRMMEKNSQAGSKITTWLEDGTKIKLNASSSIRFPEKFSDSSRVVYLEGEAFFEVKKDSTRPFIVRTDKVKATVLGTAFTVKAYPDESEIRVAVAEGKVKVDNEDNLTNEFSHTLIANQMTLLDLKMLSVTKQNCNAKIFAWKDDVIWFEDQPLKKIFRILERWYAVKIVASDNLNFEDKFSGSFENETLKAVLEALAHQGNFDYRITNNQVKIIKP
ncbi:FecR domain-containing protein [Fulvivirgaceae bacterium BMA10]|uniref:FecR domain-containing protein n=1 Tax=Splendidivirga corallicola TaxID=3051826 RepID=A0ABT8KU11_9BACT|nr:FecR domain-containing protein [Fulvivirgaceae bacterium BMA10]